MIHDFDRSGYIGSSDVRYVLGRWQGAAFERWWLEKLGVRKGHFANRFTRAGNAWEHPILRSLRIPGMVLDGQFLREDWLLRVNLDGNTPSCIYEVKTYRLKNGFHPPKWHRWQLQVQMLCSGIRFGELVYYGLGEEDYGRVGAVDPGRLKRIPVPYDRHWAEEVYLPRHMALVRALKGREFPRENF